jgi:hypothetical protein
MPGQGKRDELLLLRIPSGAGKTMLWGVNGVTGALAGKVSKEKIDRRQFSAGILIHAFHEIAGSEHGESIFLELNVGAIPASQLRGKGCERQMLRNHLGARAGLKKKGSERDQSGGGGES